LVKFNCQIPIDPLLKACSNVSRHCVKQYALDISNSNPKWIGNRGWGLRPYARVLPLHPIEEPKRIAIDKGYTGGC
jgi:hypothetical protein